MTAKKKPKVVKGFAIKEDNYYLLLSLRSGLQVVREIPKGYHQITQRDFNKYNSLKKMISKTHAYNYLVHIYILNRTT